MNQPIDLPDQNAAQLEAEAQGRESRRKTTLQDLEKHLDFMASQIVPGTTAEDMEAALEEALEHVRQQRN